MKAVSANCTEVWQSGDFTGENRPMMRATIQAMNGRNCPQPSGDETYYTRIFGQTSVPRELPNIKSMKWHRSVDNDVATCEIVLWNTAKMPLGATPERDAELDYPGYYTYNRGATTWSTSRWGHTTNSWQDMLVPDRIVRTYEGYGFDASAPPDKDWHMNPSGVWLIDDVEYDNDGLITLTMRDMGRGLLEQIMFPPVVPFKKYPIHFDTFYTVDNPDIVTVTGSTAWRHPAYSYDSGVPYVGLGGSVFGHHGSDAFDGSMSSYWLSIGNGHPSAPYAFEYVEGKISSSTVTAMKFTAWGGPYRVYFSVYSNGSWLGRMTIPYDPANPNSAPNGANIHYVRSDTVGKDGLYTYRFTTPVPNVTKVRVTFTNLYNSGIGTYPYRAGVRDFQVAVGTTSTKTTDGGYHWEGNYGDYTDIVKRLCAYGGFYWPADAGISYIKSSDGTSQTVVPVPNYDAQTYSKAGNHPYRPIETGRVWGDFENTGTQGLASLGVEIFDKKPLMDGINYVKDIVGFIFFIDEFGCAIFRSPNIWSVGNTYTHETVFHESADERLTRIATSVLAHQRTWNDVRRSVDALVPRTQVYPIHGYAGDVAASANITTAKAYVQLIYDNRNVPVVDFNTRTTEIITIDEDTTLIGLRAKLSSRNVRERVVVANVNGKIGAVFPAQGKPALNPYPSNSRRVAGWTDQNFATNDECQVMADLIAIRELFTYRTDTVTIPGYPAIQIDDQVRIFERVTNEGYVHYVRGIESSWEAETGKWTYNLDTHWLGETPFSSWVFDPAKMSAATLAYLQALGKV